MISSIDCPTLYKLWGGEIYLGSNCIDFTSVIIMIVLMQGSCHRQSILTPSAGSGARSCLFIMSDVRLTKALSSFPFSLFIHWPDQKCFWEKCRLQNILLLWTWKSWGSQLSIQWISFHCQRTVKGIGFEKTAKYESGVPYPHLRDLTRNCCSPGHSLTIF